MALKPALNTRGSFAKPSYGLRGHDVKILIIRVMGLDDATHISNLGAGDESHRQSGQSTAPLPKKIHLPVKGIKTTTPQATQAGCASILMEISGVAELNAVERSHSNRYLMEVAQDGSGVEVVIRNHR